MQAAIPTEPGAERMLMVLKIIWLALLGSLATYVIVGRFVAPAYAPPVSRETFAILRTALLALAGVTLVAAKYVRGLLLKATATAAAPARPGQPSRPQKYASAVIASLAMSESVGIYGLVLFLLGKNEMDLYLLAGISAAAMFYFRPKQDELSELVGRGS